MWRVRSPAEFCRITFRRFRARLLLAGEKFIPREARLREQIGQRRTSRMIYRGASDLTLAQSHHSRVSAVIAERIVVSSLRKWAFLCRDSLAGAKRVHVLRRKCRGCSEKNRGFKPAMSQIIYPRLSIRSEENSLSLDENYTKLRKRKMHYGFLFI